MTIYLAYKPALRKEDADMASQCIEAVSKSASKDPKFLYACCLDALHSGDKFCTLRALQLLADKHEFREDCEIHLLAVLRATIRVQVSILDGKDIDGVDSGVVARDLCGTFEAGIFCLLHEGPGGRQLIRF